MVKGKFGDLDISISVPARENSPQDGAIYNITLTSGIDELTVTLHQFLCFEIFVDNRKT